MESVHVNVHLDCLATLISGVDQSVSSTPIVTEPKHVPPTSVLIPALEPVALGLNAESSTHLETTSVAHTATKGWHQDQTIINVPASRDILVPHRNADQSV